MLKLEEACEGEQGRLTRSSVIASTGAWCGWPVGLALKLGAEVGVVSVVPFRPAGDPAEQVDRVAREGGYDTIVLGTRDLNPLERLLEGSVSEGVATRAAATVIIARDVG